MEAKIEIEREYNSAKDSGIKFIENGNHEKGFLHISYAARIAQSYPILPEYIDSELEFKLEEFVKASFPALQFNGPNKRVVFYNGQIVDSGALTEQYLDYLIFRKYNVLFIVPDLNNLKLGSRILSRISSEERIELFVPSNIDFFGKISSIRQKMLEFNASIGFLHFLPSDVVGFCSFSHTNGLIKYNIVHNDHTFWLGKKCSNFFIEFRKFGISIDIQRRGISMDKIRLLPFFPINEKEEFKGFPFNREGKIVGISGGNLYKYLMDPELKYFLEIIKMLKNNDNFIFCLCGSGKSIKIEQLFIDNGLTEQFFYLGQRSDFYSLVGECDIMFESYPFKGGLTPLFAIEQNVPVLGIGLKETASGTLEDLIGINGYTQPKNFDEFYLEGSELIVNKESRVMLAEKLKQTSMNRMDFIKGLDEILKGTANLDFKVANLEIDDDVIFNNYVNSNPRVSEYLMLLKLNVFKYNLRFMNKVQIFFKILVSYNVKMKTKGFVLLQFFKF